MAKKFKLSGVKGSVYGYDKYWALVNRVDDGFELIHTPLSCKDYTHECFANIIHKKSIFNGAGIDCTKFKRELDGLQLAMFFSLEDPVLHRKGLYSIKKYINTFEEECGIKKTLITEVEPTVAIKNTQVFVLTLDKIYIESPALLHGFIAFMRTLKTAKCEVTRDNITNVFEKVDRYADKEILKFVVKHDVFKLIMKNHENIFDGLTLKDIYPDHVTNTTGAGYHSGFGMVALCSRNLASKAYADKVNKVLDANKIPVY